MRIIKVRCVDNASSRFERAFENFRIDGHTPSGKGTYNGLPFFRWAMFSVSIQLIDEDGSIYVKVNDKYREFSAEEYSRAKQFIRTSLN